MKVITSSLLALLLFFFAASPTNALVNSYDYLGTPSSINSYNYTGISNNTYLPKSFGSSYSSTYRSTLDTLNSFMPRSTSSFGSYGNLNWNSTERSNKVGNLEYYRRTTNFNDSYQLNTSGQRYNVGNSLYDNSSSYTNEGDYYNTSGISYDLGGTTYHNYNTYDDVVSDIWGRSYNVGKTLYTNLSVNTHNAVNSLFCRTIKLFSKTYTTCN